MKNKFILVFLIITLDIFAGNNGLYDVVKIPDNRELLLKKMPVVHSQTVGGVKSATQGIGTTWKTDKKGENYWIELKYDGLIGWVKRDEVTSSEFNYKGLNEKKIDEILFRFAKAFQKGAFTDVSDLIYPVRGLAFYTDKVGKTTFYTNKQLEKSWYYTADKRFTEGTMMNYYMTEINKFLEADFKIIDTINKGGAYLPNELSNFHCATATDDKKILTIGFEIWNEKLYVAYIALRSR